MINFGNKLGSALRNVKDGRKNGRSVGRSAYVDLLRNAGQYRAAIV